MKKITLAFLLGIILLFAPTCTVRAQAPVPAPLIYGSSPFQDSLWSVDSTFWDVILRMGPSLPGFTITGITGMAYDPTTYETYVIMKVSGVSGRVLGKIDLSSGVCSQVGNLGTNFASITFDKFGQLYGATGNGATPPETLFKIDKTTAATTLMYAMGSGADGEIICYNRSDDFIYHWSGNGTVVMEKMARTDMSYTPVNIPLSGSAISGETFGSLYINPNYFINPTIASNYRRVYTNGFCPSTVASLPDDLRGPVMPPQFTSSSTTICQGQRFYTDAGSLQLFDSVTYYWGDGNFNAVAVNNAGGDGSSHVYNTAGTFTVNIILNNGFVRDTFPTFYTVTVNPKPSVSLSSSGGICPVSTSTLTASAGTASLQWYMNGSAISGETAATYTTNAPGVYNVLASNSFGCADSATTGITLMNVPSPSVTANTSAASVCPGNPVTLTGGGASTYSWTGGVTDGIAFNPTSASTYTVTGTDLNGCTGTASVAVTMFSVPTVSLSGTSSICAGNSATLTGTSGGTSQWYLNGTAISGATSNTYVASVAGVYNMTKTNLSGCSDSANTGITLIVNPLPSVGANSTAAAVCSGDMVTLTGSGASTYSWSGGVTEGLAFSPASTATYTVTGTDGAGCTNTASTTVTVNTVDVSTTTTGVTITANATGSGYQWVDCNAAMALIPGETNQTFTATANGSYAVIVTTGSCIDTSACVAVTTTGLGVNDQNNSLIVYPNPNTGSFILKSEIAGTFNISNALGQVVRTVNLSNENNFSVRIADLEAGIYMVSSVESNRSLKKRVVVTK